MGEEQIRSRLILTVLSILLSATLLTACGSKHKVSKAERPGGPVLPDGSGGSYKTGNPYQVAGRWYRPMPGVSSYDESGVASWYGSDFHGKRTANGERYDMYTLSAAHKTLPMPTLVRVTNLENGRFVIVRVNDRGPFVKNRLIDLSYAAAKELGYTEKGTTRVRVQTLDKKPGTQAMQRPQTTVASRPAIPVTPSATVPEASIPAPAPASVAVPAAVAAPLLINQQQAAGNIYVQIGAFSSQTNAEQLRLSLLAEYPNTALYPKQLVNQTLYRVRIGPFEQMQQIEQTVIKLQGSGYQQAIVVIE
ncbi:rare lipoprotein A [Mariprofundus micogutta]|uniref:Endolytic peptidoglycan transglycosylase RlpA n=1 Tax=Mariprofundus micogutta TaxID=1921010 RepID=A0A1L8CLU7_9PROT|nr:septal ring lytic transglycosylase RlpA family protein [Mariprofundus micogutta]GAV19819.1 rare lipoprotein A [Mariprofundus micogutta]